MARFEIRPVCWRDKDGRLKRLNVLIDRHALLFDVAFLHRPRAVKNRMLDWLIEHGIDPSDVEIGQTLLVPSEEGERLAQVAR